jgi:GT2 family glycosyltransferase
MPRLSIIVAVHDQLEMNRLFLEHLRSTTDGDYELIVVDNASTDGSREFFRDQGAVVIGNPANYSYPHCQNQGIAASTGDILAFLNNDLILSPHWNSRLLEVMVQNGLDLATPCTAENLEDRAATRRMMRRWKRIKNPLFAVFGARRWTLRLAHRLMYGDFAEFAEQRRKRFGARVKEGFVGAAVVMTRRAVELLGEWDPRVQAGDYDLFLRSKHRSLEQGDIRPCHVALGVFVHHYIRLTLKRRRVEFADRGQLIRIEEKWPPELAARYLAGVDS